MIRSRVTFASTDAAAMQAATRSPFQTASPGTPSPSTGNPSVRTYVGRDVEQRHRPAQRLDVGDVHAEPVALLGLDDHDRPGQRATHDLGVAALAGLLGEQLGVGQPGHDAGLACRAGSPRPRRAARRRRRGRPRRRRRSAPDPCGAGRARSRRARRRGGPSSRGGARSRGRHRRRHGASGTSAKVSGRCSHRKWSGAARAARTPCRRPGRPARTRRPGRSRSRTRSTCARRSRPSGSGCRPSRRCVPSGTGPAVQSQVGRRHRAVAARHCPCWT